MRKADFKQFLRVGAGDDVRAISLKSRYNILVSEYNLTIIQGLMGRRQQLLDQMKELKEQIDNYG